MFAWRRESPLASAAPASADERVARLEQLIADLVDNHKKRDESTETIIFNLIQEAQAERERAQYVEQQFKHVVQLIVLLDQDFRRHLGEPLPRVILPTYTHQSS